MVRACLTTLIFIAFTAYSLSVVADEGFVSAFDVALQGGWNTQVFADLCIALFVSAAWMRADAKQQGLSFWPFALSCVPLGSVAVLAYASLSAWVRLRRAAPQPLTV